jgi:hypothetical protein
MHTAEDKNKNYLIYKTIPIRKPKKLTSDETTGGALGGYKG